jgi:hypothetical protein
MPARSLVVLSVPLAVVACATGHSRAVPAARASEPATVASCAGNGVVFAQQCASSGIEVALGPKLLDKSGAPRACEVAPSALDESVVKVEVELDAAGRPVRGRALRPGSACATACLREMLALRVAMNADRLATAKMVLLCRPN